jgi:elongation factor 1-alpha
LSILGSFSFKMRRQERNHIKVIVIGCVNAGKSTTTGHLIYRLGGLENETIERYEKEARDMGRETFKYAWVLDELKAERERGLTIDLSRWNFDSLRSTFTIIDAPGHHNFVKNLITGISQGDAAFLLIDASYEAFEMSETRTKEHSMLGYIFGIKQLIIGINKMDRCEYSEFRYKKIKEEIFSHLLEIGYQSQNLFFIPISGLYGENIIERSAHMPWYNGLTLLEAFDALTPPIRLIDRPLRLSLQDVYKIGGIGTVPVGQVATGALRLGMQIIFSPSGLQSEVRSFETRSNGLTEAIPGDNIGFHSPHIEVHDIERGEVVSNPFDSPATICDSFEGLIFILSTPSPNHHITNEYSSILQIHNLKIETIWKQIETKIHRRTGNIIQQNPLFVRAGDACVVTFQPIKPIVVEKFSEFSSFGRFLIRDSLHHSVIAFGVVTSVHKMEILGKGTKKKLR